MVDLSGPTCIFYYSFGPLVVSSAYLVYKAWMNYVYFTGTFWVDLNLMKDGKIIKKNLYGFVLMSCFCFIIQNLLIITVWTARLADINVGVVSIIWSLTPLMVACMEYFMMGTKLRYYYFVGMILMLISAVLLSL